MLKRVVAIIVTVMLLIVAVGCGGTQTTSGNADNKKPEPPPKPKIEVVQDGGILRGESAEITVNKVSLSYDVMPDKTDGFYTHYPADKGNVYIAVDVDVKNIQKQNINCDKVMVVEADYNGGYQYSATPVVKDSSTGFTYANISAVKPLETKGMKYLIQCPEEVETSKNPLFVNITLDGKKYKYTIR